MLPTIPKTPSTKMQIATKVPVPLMMQNTPLSVRGSCIERAMAVAMASYAILFILISSSVVRGRPVAESEKKNAVDQAEISRTGINVTVFDCNSEKTQIGQISLVDMAKCTNDSSKNLYHSITRRCAN